MALFTTQAEYIDLVEQMKESIWLKYTIGELEVTEVCVKMHYDNKSVIHLANHQAYHVRIKHIDVWLHFIKYMIELEEIMVDKVASEENPTVVFTKSLPKSRFKQCLNSINFVED